MAKSKNNNHQKPQAAQPQAQSPKQNQQATPNVKFVTGPLFKETFDDKVKHNAVAVKKFADFQQTKYENKMQPFGSSDKAFHAEGFFTRAIPGIRHAHLTHDLSIIYRLVGSNPTTIELYGFFTHDESGTGQPANHHRQKNLATKLSRQKFS